MQHQHQRQRLDPMNLDPAWLPTGRIALEQALKLPLPSQRCFVYKIDVGGESYVGMTCQTVEQAIERHVEQARSGDGALLHVALRRIGYAYDWQLLSEHDNEIKCLIDKVSQVKRQKPSLNVTFGGEGSKFNLVEEKNEFGELCLVAEHKRTAVLVKHEQWKNSRQRIFQLRLKIKKRYDKAEELCPNFDDQFLREHFPIENDWEKSKADLFFISWNKQKLPDYSLQELSHYLRQRVRRYRLLRHWEPVISDKYAACEKGKKFLKEQKLKIQLPTLELIRRKIGTFEYSEPRDKSKFDKDRFAEVSRLFSPSDGGFLSEEVFGTEAEASEWLHKQGWFKQAILDGVIGPGDAFYSLKIDTGRYGGFAGFFTKQNYRPTHVKVVNRPGF